MDTKFYKQAEQEFNQTGLPQFAGCSYSRILQRAQELKDNGMPVGTVDANKDSVERMKQLYGN